MRQKQFVWTWWAGLVRDSFGSRSIFRVARFGVLKVCRRTASVSGGVARRGRPTAAAFAFPGLVCVPYLTEILGDLGEKG